MAYFALLWKARTIEKYRSKYEKAKLDSIIAANAELPRHTFGQKWKLYRYDSQKNFNRIVRKLCPEGSKASNFFVYLKTDQTFANFLVKSVIGFVGGIVLTYFWFMFLVFQLSISLIHATIMSSIIGVALTLGLAFSYRVRCLVFLLIPQFFSRVGRYTLTCYALVLILTGPATNTMKNSEVLSESLACGQEQVKASVTKISKSMEKPLHLIKDTMDETMKKLKYLAAKVKELMVGIHRLTMSLAHVLQSSLAWLNSVQDVCNAKLGTPYQHCLKVLDQGKRDKNLKRVLSNFDHFVTKTCSNLKSVDLMCVVGEYAKSSIVATVKKKLQTYSESVGSLVAVKARVRRCHGCCNSSSANQAPGGTVTEIRRRADPLLTWLSWSACLTSLFLLLIIFRAKYYQQMFQTRSRFDNRYVTKELRDLDFRRLKQGRETVLPLNTRERAKYVSTTSFRLLASERVHLTRSIVFMVITTFKLLIHMVADYSLYWVLMNIRFHGRFQTPLMPGNPTAGIKVTGSGPLAGIVRVLLEALSIPLSLPAPSPISCLPNPHPPDFQRYAQIGVLILLLWVFALFEPYGLRLRHVIMSRYQPERARARAEWLYNHIIRTRGSFLKYARRKLHREYKYSTEERYTFRRWLNNFIPCRCIRFLLRVGPEEPHCLLCGTKHTQNDSNTHLKRCDTLSCPGTYCARCFMDIGQLCTICLSPEDYGDLSDVSLEKGSSDDNDSEDSDYSDGGVNKPLIGTSGFRDDQFLHGNPTMYMYDNTPKAKNNDSQEATTLDIDGSKQCIHTKRDFIQEYNDQVDDESPTSKTEKITSNSVIPVIVRDKERLLKRVQVPKEKLTGVINTMKLLTTKMAAAKSNNQWSMHESKTFEYLVMNLMEPVDIFKKALIVRKTKLDDTVSRLGLHNEGKTESLKQLVPFLCAYSVNDKATNSFKNPDPVKKDLPNLNVERKAGNLALDFKKEHIKDKDSKISKRDTKLIKRCITRAIKARVTKSDSVMEKLRKRRIEFNNSKQRHHKYHYRNLSFKNRYSYQIEIKCRAYKIDLLLKKSKHFSANKCAENSGKNFENNNTEDIKCHVRTKSQELSNNFSSNFKPSDFRNPDSNKRLNDVRNRKKENDTLKTIQDIVDRNRNGKRSFYSRLWIQTKTVFVAHKLRTFTNKPNSILPNKITNHKHRKKLQIPEQNLNIAQQNLSTHNRTFSKQDNDDARNFRLSRYLKDNQEWFEEQLKKDSRVIKNGCNKTKKKLWNANIFNFILHLREKTIKRKAIESDTNKIAQKQLVRELKKKAIAEEKLKRQLKRESNKHKGIKYTKVVNQTQKDYDVNKISNETPTCHHEKKTVLSSKSGKGNSLKPIIEQTSLKGKHSYATQKLCVSNYLNFFGFNTPIDLPDESIDLDKILDDDNQGDSHNLKEQNPDKEMVSHQHYREQPQPRSHLRPYDTDGTTDTPSPVIQPNIVAKEKHSQVNETCTKKKITPEKKCMEPESKESGILGCEMHYRQNQMLMPWETKAPRKKWYTSVAPKSKEFGCNVKERGINVDDDDGDDYVQSDIRACNRSVSTQAPPRPKFITKKYKDDISLRLVASDVICGRLIMTPVHKLRHCCDALFGGLRNEKRDGRMKFYANGPNTDGTRDQKSPAHKMTQAQLTKLMHRDAQSDPDHCRCGRDVGTAVSPAHTCTCAVQYTEHRRAAKVDVGTIHHNALRKLTDKETQYEKCTLSSPKSIDLSASFTDLTEFESETKTDTTICSVATIDSEIPNKGRSNMTNRSTLTELTISVDVSTVTSDWWSPMVDKRTITQNTNQWTKSKGKERLDREVETDGKCVTFKSYADMIPRDHSDILTPSRYMLERVDKGSDIRNMRKTLKTKRLEECYSPRKRTGCYLTPASWRPAEAIDSPSRVLRWNRNSNVQIGRKSRIKRDMQDKGISKTFLKKSERLEA